MINLPAFYIWLMHFDSDSLQQYQKSLRVFGGRLPLWINGVDKLSICETFLINQELSSKVYPDLFGIACLLHEFQLFLEKLDFVNFSFFKMILVVKQLFKDFVRNFIFNNDSESMHQIRLFFLYFWNFFYFSRLQLHLVFFVKLQC